MLRLVGGGCVYDANVCDASVCDANVCWICKVHFGMQMSMHLLWYGCWTMCHYGSKYPSEEELLWQILWGDRKTHHALASHWSRDSFSIRSCLGSHPLWSGLYHKNITRYCTPLPHLCLSIISSTSHFSSPSAMTISPGHGSSHEGNRLGSFSW